MIKAAQDAYVAGSLAAMEKIASDRTPMTNQMFYHTPAYIAAAAGVAAARKAGNPNAEMTRYAYSRPPIYGLYGLFGGGALGYGLGKAYDSFVSDPKDPITNAGGKGAALGASLGLIGGYGYGLRRAYQIPGEMK
jgi:hypothetical protein